MKSALVLALALSFTAVSSFAVEKTAVHKQKRVPAAAETQTESLSE